MKKLFNLMLIASLGVTSIATVNAKPMPSDAIPTKVKIEFNNQTMQEANGFIIDGYTYVRGRDLADICHTEFLYDPNTKEVITKNASEMAYFDQERMDNDLGAYQYNNENYLQIRKVMWYMLYRPEISYDNSTKVIQLTEELTLGKVKTPMTQEEYMSRYDDDSQSTSGVTPIDTSGMTPVDIISIKPVDTSGMTPVDTSSVTPIDTSGMTPVDTSSVTPIDTSGMTPVDTSSVTPIDTSGMTPVDTSSVTPVDISGMTPVDTSNITPIKEEVSTDYIKDSDNSTSNNDNSVSNVDNNINEKVDTSKSLTVGGNEVRLGDSLDSVNAKFGEPDRIGVSRYDFDWYFYNTMDYSDFIMVGIEDDTVVGIYSNSKSFKSTIANYGDTVSQTNVDRSTILTDKNNNNKVYGVYIISDKLSYGDTNKSNYFEDYSKEVFDCTNGFRVANGRTVLKEDSKADLAVLNHCKDMADKNYFSHDGINGSTFYGRYQAVGGEGYNAIGENITAGRPEGILAVDSWVNSQGHRENMLTKEYTNLGTGAAYNGSSTYGYYAAQLFTQKR